MSDWKNVQYKDGKMRTSEGGGGGGSSTFAGLDDVSFDNLQNGQVPKYNSETGKWENADESGGGGTVTDVTVDGISVVNPQTGVAEIEMPTPPTIPVEDVEVNGESVVNAQKVAEIKSYKEVTQAEYQALPSSKLTDDILYCIKDSAGADGFPPLIYSDEEREVGVWRDGKPLYQRTFVVQKTTVGVETLLDLTNLNIESCIQTIGWFINSGRTHSYMPYFTSSSDFAIAFYQGGYLKGYNGGDHTKSSWNVTLQYTKTTDTAGSGTWTTDGTYAKHYSTSEKVIGTWIDGKPVYEKTIDFGALPNNTTKNVNHNISNIDLIVDVKGYSIAPNINSIPIPFVNDGGAASQVCLITTNSVVSLRTSADRSAYTKTYVTLRYTKTTD